MHGPCLVQRRTLGEQHYWPRFAGDALPEDSVAHSVALADKLLALAEMFGIGNAPTGDRDPFGLRRAAVGVLRILMEKQLPLSLPQLVALLSLRQSRIDLVPAQMEAIRIFSTLPEAEALAAANKRIGNILRKNESEVAPAVDSALLVDESNGDVVIGGDDAHRPR